MDCLNCIVCNVQTSLQTSYRMRTKTKYSGTSIHEIIQNFLKSTHLLRHSANDVVCQECYDKLNQYDLACRMTKEIQQDITNALYATEQEYLNEEDYVEYLEEQDFSTCQSDFDEVQAIYDKELKNKSSEQSEELVEGIEFINDSEVDLELEPMDIGSNLVEEHSSNNVEIKKVESVRKTHAVCHLCNIEFKTKTELRSHHMQNHVKKKCGICQKQFSSQIELLTHRRHEHEIDDADSDVQNVAEKCFDSALRCDFCSVLIESKEELKTHVKLHNNRYECVICNVVLKHKGNLVLHMRIHTDKKFFKCDKCEKQFVHKSSLRMHLQTTHNDVRNKPCPECPLKFKTTSQLNQHLVTHSGVKKHKCPECGKGFAQRYNMTAHYRKHTCENNPTYTCTVCKVDLFGQKQYAAHLKRLHGVSVEGSKNVMLIKSEQHSE